MKYKDLYSVLEQRKHESAGFRYTDRSGWLVPNPTYIDSIRPLWIIAEDPASGRRFWITHEGSDLSITVRGMDRQGSNYGPSRRIRCSSRTDLAKKLQDLFSAQEPAAS